MWTVQYVDRVVCGGLCSIWPRQCVLKKTNKVSATCAKPLGDHVPIGGLLVGPCNVWSLDNAVQMLPALFTPLSLRLRAIV